MVGRLTRGPIRPRVACPDDWTGEAMTIGVYALLGIAMIPALLMELPRVGWINPEVDGIILRFLVVVGVIEVWRLVKPLFFGLLPRAPVLGWGALFLRWRGRPLMIPLRDIVDMHFEIDPGGETLYIETKHGDVLPVCPLTWLGAAELAATLQRKVTKPSG